MFKSLCTVSAQKVLTEKLVSILFHSDEVVKGYNT